MSAIPVEGHADAVDLTFLQARHIVQGDAAGDVDARAVAHRHLQHGIDLRIGERAQCGVAGGGVVVVQLKRVAGGVETVVDAVLHVRVQELVVHGLRIASAGLRVHHLGHLHQRGHLLAGAGPGAGRVDVGVGGVHLDLERVGGDVLHLESAVVQLAPARRDDDHVVVGVAVRGRSDHSGGGVGDGGNGLRRSQGSGNGKDRAGGYVSHEVGLSFRKKPARRALEGRPFGQEKAAATCAGRLAGAVSASAR